tara:strand:- start:8960 stop:9535 length:576 start_codon:yes stop_codon:yes gene_type:complete
MELSEFICCYDIYDQQECHTIIDWFKNTPELHHDGKTMDHSNGSVVNWTKKVATQAYPKPDDAISHFLTQGFFRAYEKYESEHLTPKGEPLVLRDISVRVYPKDRGHFLEHFDQTAGPNATRVFAVIAYLNDVEEGGCTSFPDLNVTIKPEAGKVLIFPCSYLFAHEGEMPTSNEKYIATGFIHFQDIFQQ